MTSGFCGDQGKLAVPSIQNPESSIGSSNSTLPTSDSELFTLSHHLRIAGADPAGPGICQFHLIPVTPVFDKCKFCSSMDRFFKAGFIGLTVAFSGCCFKADYHARPDFIKDKFFSSEGARHQQRDKQGDC